MDLPTLTNEEALELTRRGANVIALNLPTGRDFGLDLRSYTIGGQNAAFNLALSQAPTHRSAARR